MSEFNVAEFHLCYLHAADGLEAEADLTSDELSGYSAYFSNLCNVRPSRRTAEETAEFELAESIATEYDRAKALSQLDNGNFSDASNAGYLERKMIPDWIWSYPDKKWLHWTGHRFQPDDRDLVVNNALLLMRERTIYYASLDTQTKARDLAGAVLAESQHKIRAALELLKSFPAINERGFELDKNPRLLGVANGVLEFSDDAGQFRAGQPVDLITKSTGIAYDPEATAPRFTRFVNQIFMGDTELIQWFQRAVGYSLTGLTSEQVLFMLYGNGANGKSVLLNVLRRLMGEYAVNLPMAALERESNPGPNRASPDLMLLRGARLATSSEVSSASQLSESRVKALTGSDAVTGRDLHRSNETFQPQAKYYLAVNDLPTVRDDSDGFWRRMRCIPFHQKFTYEGSDAEGNLRDDHLEDKLMQELPGVLAWAVRGTVAWLALGLSDTPEAVLAATRAYQDESDPYGAFLDEQCRTGVDEMVESRALYAAYRTWAEDNGLTAREIKSTTQFGKAIGKKYERGKAPRTRRPIYKGIALLAEPRQPDLAIPEREPQAMAFVQ